MKAISKVFCAVLITVLPCVLWSCEQESPEPDPIEKPGPDDPDDPDNPDNPDVPDVDPKGTALFLDLASSSNITVTAIEGEKNGYDLNVTSTETAFVVTDPLAEDLTKKNLKLSFMYQCNSDVERLEFQYSAEDESVFKGKLFASTVVDTDEEGWAAASYVINEDIADYSWGVKGNTLRIHFTFASVPVSFRIKDIYLSETSESQTPVEEPDLNKYVLTFTQDRGPHWAMEANYGIFAGVKFTRNGDEYHLLIDDQYTPNGEGIAAEHFIATDPLGRSLIIGENQVVELVFKYKASVGFQIHTGLYPFADPGVDWPASFTDSKVPASEENNPDADGWATFAHNISRSVTTKTPQWGMNVDGNDQQIRFGIQSSGSNVLHPESEGLTALDIKDIHLYVRDMREDEKPKEGEVELVLEKPGNYTDDITSLVNADGEYTITFNGGFAGQSGMPYTEYELYTEELKVALTDGVTYNMEFDYKVPYLIDDFRVMYFIKNGGGDNQFWSDGVVKSLSPAEGWTHYSAPMNDRAVHGNWGAAAGQVLRIHFGADSNQRADGANFGKELKVQVKNLKLVPQK